MEQLFIKNNQEIWLDFTDFALQEQPGRYYSCQRVKKLELYVNHDGVFANAVLHCYSAFELWEHGDFLPLFTAVHRLCFKFTIR